MKCRSPPCAAPNLLRPPPKTDHGPGAFAPDGRRMVRRLRHSPGHGRFRSAPFGHPGPARHEYCAPEAHGHAADARLRRTPWRTGIRPQRPATARPIRTVSFRAIPAGRAVVLRTEPRTRVSALPGFHPYRMAGPRRRSGLPPRRPAPTHPLRDDGAAPGPLPGPLAAGQGAGRGARREPEAPLPEPRRPAKPSSPTRSRRASVCRRAGASRDSRRPSGP